MQEAQELTWTRAHLRTFCAEPAPATLSPPTLEACIRPALNNWDEHGLLPSALAHILCAFFRILQMPCMVLQVASSKAMLPGHEFSCKQPRQGCCKTLSEHAYRLGHARIA